MSILDWPWEERRKELMKLNNRRMTMRRNFG
jgi:hypothetical protein